MKAGLRKLTLTAHIVLSVGWLGAVVAYLTLAIVGLTSDDLELARAAYLSMHVLGRDVIVPFSLATVAAGLVESLGTGWGLFRYWWVSAKFLLTTVATVILLQHMTVVARAADAARRMTLFAPDSKMLRIQLIVHAAGGLIVLLAATVLSVYRPWGMTPYGVRMQQERRTVAATEASQRSELSQAAPGPQASAPSWTYIVGFHAIAL